MRAKSNRVSYHVRCPSLPACGLPRPSSSARISLLATWVPPSAARLGSTCPIHPQPGCEAADMEDDARGIPAKASHAQRPDMLSPTCLQYARSNLIVACGIAIEGWRRLAPRVFAISWLYPGHCRGAPSTCLAACKVRHDQWEHVHFSPGVSIYIIGKGQNSYTCGAGPAM